MIYTFWKIISIGLAIGCLSSTSLGWNRYRQEIPVYYASTDNTPAPRFEQVNYTYAPNGRCNNGVEVFLRELGEADWFAAFKAKLQAAPYNLKTSDRSLDHFLQDFTDEASLKKFFSAADGGDGTLGVGGVRAWEKMFSSTDNGIKALRTNSAQLKKFDDLVKSNNLGLDADGILGIFNAASRKGYKWDFPDNILDAVKRASDANIPGLKVTHKKFPERANGGGGYLIPAKNYQKAASGDANLSFELNGRSFDNVLPDGTLIDRKFGYRNSIFDKIEDEFGEVVYNSINDNRVRALLNQAKGQLQAASGKPIRWEISNATGVGGIESLFNGRIGSYLTEDDFLGVPFNLIKVEHK